MAGYDISASASQALSQASNLTAGTVINFGQKATVDGGWYSQENTPSSVAVAARNAGDTDGKAIGSNSQGVMGPTKAEPNWFVIGGIALGAVALVAAVVILKK